MSRITVSVLLAASTLFIVGCATSTPQSRIAERREAFSRLPEEAQRKIKAGEIDLGFTEEMVRFALGKPGREFSRTDANGSSVVWVYYKRQVHGMVGVAVGSGGYRGVATGLSLNMAGDPDDEYMRVIFRDGKVAEIETVRR